MGKCLPTRAPTSSRSSRRGWETFSDSGVGGPDQRDSLWWRVAGRNKRSLTVDLRTPDGQDLIRHLARDVDIVVENFRPGTMERSGLGYDVLSGINPGLILVRISGFGQTGPYAKRAGYAAIGEAMGGLRALTGYADRPPTRVGVSLGDSLTGLMGAWGAVCALQARNRTGRGQVVDATIFESVLAITEGLVPEWHVARLQRERSGPTLPGIAPSNVYPTTDGHVLIAANQDSVFRRLTQVMERPEIADDPRYVDHRARGANMSHLDHVDRRVDPAIHLGRTARETARCRGAQRPGVRAGRHDRRPALPGPAVAGGGTGRRPRQHRHARRRAPAFRNPGRVRWRGPLLGQHTDDVLQVGRSVRRRHRASCTTPESSDARALTNPPPNPDRINDDDSHLLARRHRRRPGHRPRPTGTRHSGPSTTATCTARTAAAAGPSPR